MTTVPGRSQEHGVRRRGGGQRRGRDDGRADRRAPRPSVLVIEKTEAFGGSTARSGGGIWAPGNVVLRNAGVTDTPAGPRLPGPRGRRRRPGGAAEGTDRARPGHAEPGPGDDAAALAWVPGYADYYPEAPGGLAAGRSIEPVPLDGRVLGAELAHLGRPYLPSPVAITQAEYRWLTLGPRHPRAMLAGIRVAGRAARTRLLGHRMLSLGQALAAGLRAGLRPRRAGLAGHPDDRPGGTGRPGHRGRVTRGGEPPLIRARRGVLIATGGFERNEEMRRRYQRAPVGTEWTTGAAGNTGDGILAGQDLGAATGLMDDAWWGPSIPLPGGPYFCLAERSLPGCLLVNGAGQRFVNESAPYVDAVHAMYDGNTPRTRTSPPG